MIGPHLLDRIFYRQGYDRRAFFPRPSHHFLHHTAGEKGTHRVVHENYIDVFVNRFKRMSDRILSFFTPGNDLCHFCEMVRRHDLGEAVLHVALKDSQNNFVDQGRGVKNPEGMKDDRLSAECEELFGDRTSHSKPSSGGRNERNSSMSLMRKRISERRTGHGHPRGRRP
jgi:hypothetical protein